MKLAATILCGIALASCAPIGDTEPTIGTVKNSTEVRVAGEARRCLTICAASSALIAGTRASCGLDTAPVATSAFTIASFT